MQKQIRTNPNNLKLSLIRPYRPYKSFVCIRNNRKMARET